MGSGLPYRIRVPVAVGVHLVKVRERRGVHLLGSQKIEVNEPALSVQDAHTPLLVFTPYARMHRIVSQNLVGLGRRNRPRYNDLALGLALMDFTDDQAIVLPAWCGCFDEDIFVSFLFQVLKVTAIGLSQSDTVPKSQISFSTS